VSARWTLADVVAANERAAAGIAALKKGAVIPAIQQVRADDAPLMSLAFSMPWPPTVNTYWRHTVRGGKKPKDGAPLKKSFAKVYLSKQGLRYQSDALGMLRAQKVPRGALRGRLAVHVTAYPPDHRVRDLDNLCKGLFDALKHGGIIVDDGDIDDMHVVRGPVRSGGVLLLKLSELGTEVCVQPALDLQPKPNGAPPF
jgi:crossover junction endodeoxyribonuclease RusA